MLKRNNPIPWSQRSGDEYFERYWNSHDDPRRPLVNQAIKWLGGPELISSVLDLGCHAGPGLRAIHHAFPELRLYGVDVNEDAIIYGRMRAVADGWDFHGLRANMLYDLDRVTDWLDTQSIDVITTGYTLAYAQPPWIHTVLRWMQRTARVGIILAEPTSLFHSRELPLANPEQQIPAWAHPYPRYLESSTVWKIRWSRDMMEWPVDPVRDGLNFVLGVRRSLYR